MHLYAGKLERKRAMVWWTEHPRWQLDLWGVQRWWEGGCRGGRWGWFVFWSLNWVVGCCCCYCPVAKSCLTLCDPMDCSMPGFPVLHHPLEFAQTHVHWAIQPSHPLLPSSLAPSLSQWWVCEHLFFFFELFIKLYSLFFLCMTYFMMKLF